jgi:hypothetical protein
MGPKEGRSGPAKIKNKRREQMNEEIENVVSDVVGGEDDRTLKQKAQDLMQSYQDRAHRYRVEGADEYSLGGDVRYSSNRGKTY